MKEKPIDAKIIFLYNPLPMDVFDIIGPVMIGPSSSHTAGAVRLGYFTRVLLAEPPAEAIIYLHGSFARTYQGHGTDRAIAAGILGMKPENPQIKHSLSMAKESGLDIVFKSIELTDAHSNTALIELTGESGKKLSVQGSSVGGGNIKITNIDGKSVCITGKYPTLVVEYSDIYGKIAAIASVPAKHKMNISEISVARNFRGGTATMCLQMDGMSVSEELKNDILKIDNVFSAIIIQPV